MSAKLKELSIPKAITATNPRLTALLKELRRHLLRQARAQRTGCG